MGNTIIKAPSAEKLTEWRELTNANAHTEARLDICNWLMIALRDDHYRPSVRHAVWTVERVMQAIKVLHDVEGSLTPELFALREKYTTMMIEAVRRVSPDVAAMIYDCL